MVVALPGTAMVDVADNADEEGATKVDGNVTEATAVTGVDVAKTGVDDGVQEVGKTMGAEAPVPALPPAATRRVAGGNNAAGGGGLPEKLTPWAIGRA